MSTCKTNSGREDIELCSIPKALDGWKEEAKFIGENGCLYSAPNAENPLITENNE